MTGPRLAPGRELLDDAAADPSVVRQSLHHIARSNRWFGGWWAVRRGLEDIRRHHGGTLPRRLTLLDVGTGAGDLPLKAVRWARRHGSELRPIGLERHRAAAALAREAGIPSVLGCAGALPLRPGSVDLLLASQFMHHLAEDEIVRFCQAATRVARLGVIVADLRRSPLALAGFWLGSRLFGFDATTRHDGLVSVRRGFTAGELGGLLRQAGLRARVAHSPGFRLVATWTPAAAGA